MKGTLGFALGLVYGGLIFLLIEDSERGREWIDKIHTWRHSRQLDMARETIERLGERNEV